MLLAKANTLRQEKIAENLFICYNDSII